MLTLVSSMLLCFLLLWLLSGALSCALYPLLRNTMTSIDPAQASTLMLAWFAMPVLIAGLTSAVMYSPDVAAWLVTGHCHLGSCRQHGPQAEWATLPATLLLLWTGLRLCSCLLPALPRAIASVPAPPVQPSSNHPGGREFTVAGSVLHGCQECNRHSVV